MSSKSQSTLIRRRACAICVRAKGDTREILMVELEDPISRARMLTPPGGAIEENERAAEAALRETFEETGYRVVVTNEIPTLARYPFVWAGMRYDCETAFFLCRLSDPQAPRAVVKDADYNLGCRWVSEADLPRALSFSAPVRDAVMRCLAE